MLLQRTGRKHGSSLFTSPHLTMPDLTLPYLTLSCLLSTPLSEKEKCHSFGPLIMLKFVVLSAWTAAVEDGFQAWSIFITFIIRRLIQPIPTYSNAEASEYKKNVMCCVIRGDDDDDDDDDEVYQIVCRVPM